jgi:hypothetical protein
MADKLIKKYSTSLVMNGMQLKTTLRVHCSQNGYPQENKKLTNANEDLKGREKLSLYTVRENVNQCSHYGNQYGGHSKNKNRTNIGSCYPTPKWHSPSITAKLWDSF